MKRTLIALLLPIVGCFVSGQQAFVGPGVTPVPVGIVTSTATIPVAMFFVSNSGSDAANGLTLATPWQTVAKVNSSATVGSQVNFNGGQTFTTTAGITADVSVASYGTGQATISSGNSAPCVSNTNPAGARSINNIICTGGGNVSNTTDGISFVNNQPGNTKLPGPTITNTTVSGYGGNCVSILGANGTSGFNGIIFTGNTLHDCTGTSTNSFGTAGLMIASSTGYGFGATAPSNINLTIKKNNIFNMPGATAASTNWTGSGMYIAQCGGTVTIGGSPTDNNLVHDFGSQNGSTFEPAGILFADCGVTAQSQISYFEIYNGQKGTNATTPALADGLVIDGGAVGMTAHHFKNHDNAGLCVLFENYTDAALLTWANNSISWYECQNNASSAFARTAEILFHFPRSATGPGSVTNGTIVNQNGGNAFGDSADSTGSYTMTVANNALGVTNGGSFVHFLHPSTLTFAGNDYWSYGTTATFQWAGASGTPFTGTLASAFSGWQTATGQEKISGSNVGLTVNPQIYVPGGLFITGGYSPTQDMANNLQAGSPMIGAGLNLTTQFGINPGSTDYYGVAISASSLPVGTAAGDFASFAASCTASTNFLARVSSFTKLDNVNYNSLLCSGAFANFDLLYVMAAPNSAASLLNLMGTTFPLTTSGSPTFTARTGYTGNGTSAFLNTGWSPATNAVNYTLASVTHFGYALTDGKADTEALYGVFNVAATAETSNFPGTGGWFADANDNTGFDKTSTTTSKGLFLLDRTAGNLTAIFDGGQIGSPSAVAAVALPDRNMYILGYDAGTANQFSTNTIAAAGFGAGGQNDLLISEHLSGFMQAYGINVY